MRVDSNDFDFHIRSLEFASLKTCKKEAKKAAKELQYGPDVLAKIDEAKTDREIRRIMADARRSKTHI